MKAAHTVECPVRNLDILPDVPMFMMRVPGTVTCPGCGQLHYWDPVKKALLKGPPGEDIAHDADPDRWTNE
jgi:hypothetical protein